MLTQLKKAADNAARQRALRERRAADGLAEVRGIYARPEHHARIKAYAARLAKAKPA